MSVIMRNEHGAIAVNKGVLEKMIVEDLLGLGDTAFLCSKKGKLIKGKPGKKIDPDYYDAIEIYEKKGEIKVKVFIIPVFGSSISHTADEIFTRIEDDFALLRLPRPGLITVAVRGVLVQDQIVRRDIEVVRKNA